MNDLKIDFNIDETFNEIENVINEIESNLQKLYDASIIDESFWNTKEYETYNTEYLTYLKKSCSTYPLYLRNYLEFMKSAIDKYQYLDLSNKKES
ncbi:MAG: hypothetical protein IJ068_01810 [Bacilli bacterium]|nr:hypothetical protein [Bacilli bacterium]